MMHWKGKSKSVSNNIVSQPSKSSTTRDAARAGTKVQANYHVMITSYHLAVYTHRR